MAGDFRLASGLRVTDVDRSDRSAPVADVEALGGRVVPHVVRVVAQSNAGATPKIIGAQQLHTVTLAIRNGDDPGIRRDRDPLRLVKSRELFEMRARSGVDDLDGVIAERSDKQSSVRRIEGQMVDAAFDAWQRDRAGEHERLRRCRLDERERNDHREFQAVHDVLSEGSAQCGWR